MSCLELFLKVSTSVRDGELVSNILKRQKKHLFKLFLICCVSFLVRQKINYLNVIILGSVNSIKVVDFVM